MQQKTALLKPVDSQTFDPRSATGSKKNCSVQISHYKDYISSLANFATGKNFWYIADMAKGAIIKTGGNYEMAKGFSAESENVTADDIFRCVHPEDLPFMLACSNYVESVFTNAIGIKKLIKARFVRSVFKQPG